MEANMKLPIRYVAAACLAHSVLIAPVMAQQGITRTPLSTTDFPPGYQSVMGIAQIPANICFDRHTHPGIENAYLLEGEIVLKIEGKADQHLKAGTAVQIPPGAPHIGCTMGSAAKVLTVHIIEKGKPLASPAP
jgi:quercetin dioxygenase-like cupin family protein